MIESLNIVPTASGRGKPKITLIVSGGLQKRKKENALKEIHKKGKFLKCIERTTHIVGGMQ